jgi:hypothetical protein
MNINELHTKNYLWTQLPGELPDGCTLHCCKHLRCCKASIAGVGLFKRCAGFGTEFDWVEDTGK